jgi:hypothetical protein
MNCVTPRIWLWLALLATASGSGSLECGSARYGVSSHKIDYVNFSNAPRGQGESHARSDLGPRAAFDGARTGR